MSSPMIARARAFRPMAHLPRPRLTIVPKIARRAPRIPFVLLVVTVLAVGLVGLLLLNTALQRGAYELTDLKQTSAGLTNKQQNLQMQVADLQQPQRLAEKAVRLGMVQNDSPAFLSLSTGAVVGMAVPGAPAKKVDIGHTAVTTAGQAAKVTPLVAGEHATASISAERHQGANGGPVRPEGPGSRANNPTKSDDTAPISGRER